MCNEYLPMKPFQFFKIYKRFDKEREKTLIQQSVRKEKLREVVLKSCSINDCFIKPFKMIINHFFYFACSLAAQFFKIYKRFDKERELTLIQQSVRKEKLRKVVLKSCSINDCFIKPFKIIINHFFYFACSLAAQFFFLH